LTKVEDTSFTVHNREAIENDSYGTNTQKNMTGLKSLNQNPSQKSLG
jgi:hypothetical protein